MDIKFKMYKEYCRIVGLKESDYRSFKNFMIHVGLKY